MDKHLMNVYKGLITGVDEIKDGTYESINYELKEQIGTISGVFKYSVNKHEIQWFNNELVNKNFGAILKGDKFKLSVKVVSQDVLNTLPEGDYEFKDLKAKVIGFYYRRNEDYYGTGWMERQFVYELCTDYVFTIVATEQYLNGYRLLTFYPNIPFIEGTEYIKEIDPDYALTHRDSYGNIYKDSFHLQDPNFHNHFKVFKNEEYIGITNPYNIDNNIYVSIYSNNKYNYYKQYIRSLLINPIGLQYSINLLDIGYTETLRLLTIKINRGSYKKDVTISNNWEIGNTFNSNRTNMVNDNLSKLVFSKGEPIFEINHEKCSDVIAIDDKLFTGNEYIPVISYKYYYFTTKDTFLGEYLNAEKIQQQNIVEEDFGCNVYYIKDKELIVTSLSMKSCMEIIHFHADYISGSSCMIHKFIINNETFYVVNRELVYILNCLITDQTMINMQSYHDIYLKHALYILKKYNFKLTHKFLSFNG